ncbi:alpha/beta-hydrolase [Aspergillus ambiguus]|uniref:alpha/beta hydrolase n=1 Tax=Aspergillus ambiguus TaxID=176160 RepID=UPI003CCD3559
MAPKLSFIGKLRVVFNIVIFVFPSAVARIAQAVVRAWQKNLPLKPTIWNGFVGSLMVNIPPGQLQAILPSTFDTYESWMLSKGNVPRVDVAADNSTRILWVGPREGNKVLMFLHGGGYVMPLSKGHLEWIEHIRQEACDAGVQLNVCVLEYDLIPANPYPRQMLQAIFALQCLFSLGYQPSDVIFGGDSAGGHLSLALLSHLHRRRQFESMETSIDRIMSIRGCFLVSPLCSFNFNTPSYKRWLSADVLGRQVVSEWGDHLMKGSPWLEEVSGGYGWGMALDVPEKWWEGLDCVDRILVTGGYEEVFSDHVQQLGDVLQRNSKGEVELYMANETHDGPLFDFAAGRPPSEMTKAITHFIVSSCK